MRDDKAWKHRKETGGQPGQRKAVLFAGTTEGRLLAAYLTGLGCRTVVCVATEYGRDVLEQDGLAGGTDGKGPDDRLLDIRQGRLDQKSMEGLLEEVRPGMVIDATHPYAAEVSENIRRACTAFPHILFIRCLRRESGAWDNPVIRVPDVRAAVQWLAGQEGNILVTTGVKELSAFCSLPDYRKRIYARVLPSVESEDMCRTLGYEGRHIIAMQGPFSMEMNLALLREFKCRFLVTKDGGKAGGMEEKLEASRAAGVRTLLIDRPKSAGGISLEDVKKQIKEWMEHER